MVERVGRSWLIDFFCLFSRENPTTNGGSPPRAARGSHTPPLNYGDSIWPAGAKATLVRTFQAIAPLESERACELRTYRIKSVTSSACRVESRCEGSTVPAGRVAKASGSRPRALPLRPNASQSRALGRHEK